MKRQKSLRQIVFFALVIVLLVGCGGETVEPTSVPSTSDDSASVSATDFSESEPSILPTDTAVSPTNTPLPPTDTPIPPTSTPVATTGEVRGILVNSGGSPVKASMPLTPVTVSSDGSFSMPFDALSTAEKGDSNSSGEFIFENLDPGHYILTAMVGSMGTGSTLMDEQDKPVIIEVEAGQVIDLGEVAIEN